MAICDMIPMLTLGALTCAPEGGVSPAAEAGDTQSSILMTAAAEAVYTLAAFLVAGLMIHYMQQRNMKTSRMRKAVLKAKTIESTLPDDIQAATGASAFPKKPAVVPARRDTEAVMAAVRGGRAAELPALLAAARTGAIKYGHGSEALSAVMGNLLESALRACASRRYFREALNAYDEVMAADGNVDICGHSWSVLLYSAVETRQFSRCPLLIEKLLKTSVTSSNDFFNIVRYYSHKQDVEALKETIAVLNARGFVIDVIGRNRALAACTTNRALELAEVLANDELMGGSKMDVIGYNTLMKCYLEAGQPTKCLEAYDAMQCQGEKPSDVTFGVLLDACNDTKDADRALQVSQQLRTSGIRMNVIHYTTLMKVLAKVGRIDAANELLDEMLESTTVKPDMVAYSTLVKANADRGNLAPALRVLEKMCEQGISPDNTVFHMVLGACIMEGLESSLIMHVFYRLVGFGMKSTTTTLSLLLKALAKAQDWDGALDMLRKCHDRLKLYPEVRLFAQLAQACASAGVGDKALDCYFALVHAAAARGHVVDEATNARLLRHCEQGEEAATAARLHALVAGSRGPVLITDLEALARQR